MTTSFQRSAGIGGVLAFTVWLLQPLAVFVLHGDEEGLTWESVENLKWTAPYSAATFLTIALGMFLLVRGVDGQLGEWRQASSLSAAGRVAGYVGVGGWLFLVTTGSSLYSSASGDLADLAVADQTTALALHGVIAMASLHLASLGTGLWLLMVGTHARSRGIVGRPTAYAALVAGVAALVPFGIPFSAPWGSLGVFVMALWLGIHQLRASRAAEPVATPVLQEV